MKYFKTYEEAKTAYPDCDGVIVATKKYTDKFGVRGFLAVNVDPSWPCGYRYCECHDMAPVIDDGYWKLCDPADYEQPKSFRYEVVKFEFAWEAVKAFEDGEELYRDHDADGDFVINKGPYKRIFDVSEAAHHWQILFHKVELKWYDNIPVGGVLCYVCDAGETEQSIRLVVKYSDENSYPFEDDRTDLWQHATPLTKSEIEVFLNNAPE